ncbi:MAG: 4-alpha-glucanotransferase [Chlamydiia bacterium]|nr:4-alpha-glucanotransferase [Chlamydiia bacterium]MCH9618712.1 4-alpha-glucanotransferase [Chlamydiia bacterium]MCH9624392.1 4-alpha-glucanotransferase [Chlamydiia bacterium]
MKKIKIDLEEKIKASHLKDAWENIGIHHHHGINIPLFSIHSKDSCGIGEFFDLKLLIDFAQTIKMDIIQLLPLNDSGYESSPYNAVSSLALNPIYISLKKLPFIKSDKQMQLELSGFRKYNYLQKVAYNAVLTAKLSFLRKYYDRYFLNFKSSPSYQGFLKEGTWLQDYGLFKCLKEDYAHKGWFSWEEKHKNISEKEKKSLLKEKKKEISFYIFLQFLAFSQLEEVKEYAQQKKVFLKGDIPILISPESLDVWEGRKNFNLNYCAGAPPDQFSAEGQNWGFPIYDWKYMEKTNYAFWSDRLKTAGRLYHLYRIDHIIGLYKIYAIPRSGEGKGRFIPDDQDLAITSGEKILEKLTSFSTMLPIGEDLGANNESIRKSLSRHAIPGTKIPRWEKNYLKDDAFIPYDLYNPLSLTCVSTHDSETLALWWKNNPIEAKAFAQAFTMEYKKHLTHHLRYQMLKASHNSASLFHINLLPESLALFEDLVWDYPEDERINIPGTILPSNWCYKMRPSLEHLLEHDDLKNVMRDLAA